MEALQLAEQLRFGVWASRRMLAGVRQVAEEAFTAELPVAFGSLRGTLVHMFGTEWYWHRLLCGEEKHYPAWLDQEGRGASAAEMADDYERLLEHYLRLADALTDPDRAPALLAARIQIHGAEIPFWQGVMNIVSHGTYHRGQVAMLLRQFGVKPLGTDIIHFYFEQAGHPWPY